MKCISSFYASKVYQYTSIDINFFEDLTFLYGLNGSGKTTALRLIMALLVPSIKTLIEIPFETLNLDGQLRNGKPVNFFCEKSDSRICLRTSLKDDELYFDIPKADNDEIEVYLEREFRNHPVVSAIRDIASPIFLGLDRRFITPTGKNFRANFNSRQMAIDFERETMLAQHRNFDPGLAEVSSIIVEFIRSLKYLQQRAESKFRKQLLLDSFAYIESGNHGFATSTPSEKMFSIFREKRKTILATLKKLDLASEEFEQTSEMFFSKIEKVIDILKRTPRKTKKAFDEEYLHALTAWMVNQHQVDRIERLFQLVTDYQQAQEEIFRPISEFNILINNFFNQTGKRLEIGSDGTITIRAGEDHRPLQGLSSGERQILIMLAHLSLNRGLRKDGIFIVDEPELSLHMAWQDMFVEAVQSANPRLQVILATHSPAIIAGNREKCVPIQKVVY